VQFGFLIHSSHILFALCSGGLGEGKISLASMRKRHSCPVYCILHQIVTPPIRGPIPRRLASPVVADAFIGELTRGSIVTIPATAETEKIRSYRRGVWLTTQSSANRSHPLIPCFPLLCLEKQAVFASRGNDLRSIFFQVLSTFPSVMVVSLRLLDQRSFLHKTGIFF
jgi:hypothetical protein